jgi:glycine cleavage system aminomethyltransferase T
MDLKTKLFDKHVELGAKMVPFAGWFNAHSIQGTT